MSRLHQPWETLATEVIFVAPPWIRLSVQKVRLPNGRVVEDYYQLSLPDYALIFAQTSDGLVIMERGYKHGAGMVTLTLPAGSIEDGEEPLAAAKRELLEETGYASSHWERLGCFVQSGNYGCGKAHLFVARHAERVAEPHSGDLEEMEVVLLKPEEIVQAVRTGDLVGLGTLGMTALATNPLFASLGHDGSPEALGNSRE